MKLFVGITDRDWFAFLRGQKAEEMNFWRPRSTAEFSVLKPGELFLFKTRFPENQIVGGAFFVRHTVLPLNLAWEVFGQANGVPTLDLFRRKICSLREDSALNPQIGCTVLTQPFYLKDDEFWPAPIDWPRSIVVGKSYPANEGIGEHLYSRAIARVRGESETAKAHLVEEPRARYGSRQIVFPRLGQGGFRVVIMDEYSRRCAVTGERTLPVLQAAHIRPYAEDGPHEIGNGIFLRSDMHTLFDLGYFTVTDDYRVEVSKRIRDEFSNGRDYYAFHGKELTVLPSDPSHRPAASHLEWHRKRHGFQ